MAKCLNVDCNNEVVSQEGKRQKKTCSDSCRQKVWQNNKKDSKYVRVLRIEWEKIVQGISERENKLINAARGRDESGINEDEIILTRKSDVLPKQVIVKIKDKEFRPRRDDESGMEYRIALEEWRISNK